MTERPVLDLTKQHSSHVDGELTVIFTWYGETVDDSEPCVVLIPTYRMLAPGHYKPCVIALSSAYKYDDAQYLWESAAHIANILGLGASATFKVADKIQSSLLELIKMPPRPVEQAVVVADAIMTTESGRQTTAEIIEER